MFPVDFTFGTVGCFDPEVLEREICGPLSASNLLEVAAWPDLAGRRSAEVDGIGIWRDLMVRFDGIYWDLMGST